MTKLLDVVQYILRCEKTRMEMEADRARHWQEPLAARRTCGPRLKWLEDEDRGQTARCQCPTGLGAEAHHRLLVEDGTIVI